MREPPVFVVGCPRSGTTLLYHMLLSSGDFVDYRAETHFFDKLLPAFGPFSSRAARQRLFEEWVTSPSFQRFGVPPEKIAREVVEDCKSAGEILRTVFREVAVHQDKPRWAECTPAHLLSMDRIRQEIPDAIFLHIIRDGRDVALSLRKLGWTHPLPWDRDHELLVGGWTWDWQVRKGRRLGRRLSEGYHEVRFEDLVRRPRDTLERVSDWIRHPLQWDQLKENPVGSMARPNTAFAGQQDGRSFDPVSRWERQCTDVEVGDLQLGIGDMLSTLGYRLARVESSRGIRRLGLRTRKQVFQTKRELQFVLKEHTFLSRILTNPELEDL